MRWRDSQGDRFRLRQERLAWPALCKPGVAADLIPGGLGQDPISLVIGLPGLTVFCVVLAAWLVELAVRLVLAPGAAALRLASVLPFHLELRKNGWVVTTYRVVGYRELRRLRAAVREQTHDPEEAAAAQHAEATRRPQETPPPAGRRTPAAGRPPSGERPGPPPTPWRPPTERL